MRFAVPAGGLSARATLKLEATSPRAPSRLSATWRSIEGPFAVGLAGWARPPLLVPTQAAPLHQSRRVTSGGRQGAGRGSSPRRRMPQLAGGSPAPAVLEDPRRYSFR